MLVSTDKVETRSPARPETDGFRLGSILGATLNPAIIPPAVSFPILFTNLDTYSQVAGCTPEKIVSQFARLECLNHHGFSGSRLHLRHAASFIRRLNPG